MNCFVESAIKNYLNKWKTQLKNNKDLGALRIKSIGVKDNFCKDFPLYKNDGKEYNENVVLEIDYWVLIPKKK